MSEKLIVALDVPGLNDAEKLVKSLSTSVKIFKVGKELFTSAGSEVVKMIHSHRAKVFLDLKFHDIPNTVAGACAAATRLGVFMMNVHASGGSTMMKAAAEAVKKTAKGLNYPEPILIGVTVLTSMAQSDLVEIGVQKELPIQVKDLAVLAKSAGLGGVVASPLEIETIRKATGKDFVIVTPGVRPEWASTGDQKRVMTPKEAVQKGADFIVVGRPITADKDPLNAAKRILDEIK